MGETLSDAIGVYANGVPSDAAEIAAERRCHFDAEYGDHKVAVSLGGITMIYNVTVRSEPVFSASETFST